MEETVGIPFEKQQKVCISTLWFFKRVCSRLSLSDAESIIIVQAKIGQRAEQMRIQSGSKTDRTPSGIGDNWVIDVYFCAKRKCPGTAENLYRN